MWTLTITFVEYSVYLQYSIPVRLLFPVSFTSNRPKESITRTELPPTKSYQVTLIKSKWKMKDERWKMDDESWNMKDERWSFMLLHSTVNGQAEIVKQKNQIMPFQNSVIISRFARREVLFWKSEQVEKVARQDISAFYMKCRKCGICHFQRDFVWQKQTNYDCIVPRNSNICSWICSIERITNNI